jgi:catechol 2,3-dioxygenase-like lactoylglutathione lyase family enzyme
MTETKTTTQITQLATVVLPVSDQSRAVEFYVDTLGFEKRVEAPMGDHDPWIEVAPQGAATTIALYPPREGNPTGIDTNVAFETEDIDALHAELKDRGVDVDEEVSRMGDPVPPMFFFRDPDGNQSFVVQRS